MDTVVEFRKRKAPPDEHFSGCVGTADVTIQTYMNCMNALQAVLTSLEHQMGREWLKKALAAKLALMDGPTPLDGPR